MVFRSWMGGKRRVLLLFVPASHQVLPEGDILSEQEGRSCQFGGLWPEVRLSGCSQIEVTSTVRADRGMGAKQVVVHLASAFVYCHLSYSPDVYPQGTRMF